MKNTLLIDNYDSFTYNLHQYLGELGANPKTVYNNEISLNKIIKFDPSHIVISPGPGRPDNPEDFGICSEVIKTLGTTIPILGVCLGHQGIIHAFGGKIIEAPEIMHGKKSEVSHNEKGIFQNIPNPITVMRYHSLVGDPQTFPHNELEITAHIKDDQTIMGIQHRSHPIYGIQFHPESIGTPHGKEILGNFLSVKS